MNETGRVTSTARKISRAWFRRLCWIFIRLNIVLLAMLVVGFCYYHERVALGRQWTFEVERGLELPPFDHGANELTAVVNAISSLDSATYVFSDVNGNIYEADCYQFITILKPMIVAVGIIELMFIFGQLGYGRRMARRLLRPLDKMAMAAQELSQKAAFVEPPSNEADYERLHDLQDAISKISPNHPEEKLQMGDKDLQGLQDAINSLLMRMHDSYRQQARFVSDASHELRTPIAVIQGYAGMLDRWGKQDEKILDESISAIKGEASYMNKLVEQLLFLARGDTGRNRMEFKEESLTELIKEVYEDCMLIDKTHDWRINVNEDVKCVGDWDMLKQCARILVDNATKYTPEGGAISLRAYHNDKGLPCIEVQDSGIGISSADIQHIFDRFYRSDPARGRSNGGAGLGLSIAKWIVDKHKGHFEVLSRENLGTRVSVVLSNVAAKQA